MSAIDANSIMALGILAAVGVFLVRHYFDQSIAIAKALTDSINKLNTNVAMILQQLVHHKELITESKDLIVEAKEELSEHNNRILKLERN